MGLLHEVVYQDEEGRFWRRGLPEGVPDSEAVVGVPLGPPPLSALGLPLDVEVRLHNELFSRGIFNERQASTRLGEVIAAVQAAYRVDAHRVLAIFQGTGAVNAAT